MDVPTPVKHSPHMKDYRIAEDKALEQAARIFNLIPPVPKEIKAYDKRLMVTEALRFMNTSNYDWKAIAKPLPLHIIGTPLEMKEAELAFLNRWYELFES